MRKMRWSCRCCRGRYERRVRGGAGALPGTLQGLAWALGGAKGVGLACARPGCSTKTPSSHGRPRSHRRVSLAHHAAPSLPGGDLPGGGAGRCGRATWREPLDPPSLRAERDTPLPAWPTSRPAPRSPTGRSRPHTLSPRPRSPSPTRQDWLTAAAVHVTGEPTRTAPASTNRGSAACS